MGHNAKDGSHMESLLHMPAADNTLSRRVFFNEMPDLSAISLINASLFRTNINRLFDATNQSLRKNINEVQGKSLFLSEHRPIELAPRDGCRRAVTTE